MHRRRLYAIATRASKYPLHVSTILWREPSMVKRTLLAAITSLGLFAQGGGRGIPGLSEAQTAALTRMTADLAPQVQALTAARTALIAAAFTEPRNDGAIRSKAEAVGAAELALGTGRAESFARLQTSSAKLAPDQVAAFRAAGGIFRGGAPGGAGTVGGRGTIPNIRQSQTTALTQLSMGLMPLTRMLNSARNALAATVFADSRNDAAIRAKAESVQVAEMAVAQARAEAFGRIQASANRLNADQIAAFVGMGGSFAGVAFTQPEPYNFSEHEGYIPLFDGVSLKGWDGIYFSA